MYLQFLSEPSYYFGLLCFYLLFFSSALPSLCLFFPFRLFFWVICWHNLVRSLEFEEISWHGVQVHRDFCLITPQTLRLQCFLYLRHNIFRHQFAKQVGCEYPACPWFVRAGGASLSSSDSALTFATLINRASFWSITRRFFSPPGCGENFFLSFFFF